MVVEFSIVGAEFPIVEAEFLIIMGILLGNLALRCGGPDITMDILLGNLVTTLEKK